MAVAFTENFKLPRIMDRTHLGLPPAFIIKAEDVESTYMPWTEHPQGEALPLSGFMDDQGEIHFEFNHSIFKPKKYLNWKSLLRPAHYYEALVREFLGTSLIKDEKRLILGGHAWYHFEKRECHILNLVILPRHLIPDVDPKLRKEAIFRIQTAFDRMNRRLGAIQERTATLVIPDARMRALGYEQVKPKGWRDRWDRIREFWPISLRGMQRIYVKRLENG